jgi:hypothetical protein
LYVYTTHIVTKNIKDNRIIRIGSEMVGRMKTFLRYSISSFLKEVGKRMKSHKNQRKDLI